MQQVNRRLLNWASVIEPNTLAQAELTSTLPFIYPHVALMPDAHLGKGATVGSVIPTQRAVIPAAVGVDIGCGMIAVRTQFTTEDIDLSSRSFLREEIERRIPLSAGKYNQSMTDSVRERAWNLEAKAIASGFEPASYAGNWNLQLGSLGSGNHFIEVSADEEDRLWLFLHSGSRGVGNKIAQHHIQVAQKLMERWWISLPDPDLAYLPMDTPEFTRYMAELHWAQEFALANREEMMDRVIDALTDWMHEPVIEEQRINCHHNYTAWERHFGKDLIVSRKGAIDAHTDIWGLIPGSMGDKSYVVRGLGNRAALCSAPHGAGRVLSRSAARKMFTQDKLREWMQEAGTEYRDTDAFIDEHPLAYKRIDQVMLDASDLVTVEHTLHALLNVKGD